LAGGSAAHTGEAGEQQARHAPVQRIGCHAARVLDAGEFSNVGHSGKRVRKLRVRVRFVHRERLDRSIADDGQRDRNADEGIGGYATKIGKDVRRLGLVFAVLNLGIEDYRIPPRTTRPAEESSAKCTWAATESATTSRTWTPRPLRGGLRENVADPRAEVLRGRV
jgi:hypothetical protein